MYDITRGLGASPSYRARRDYSLGLTAAETQTLLPRDFGLRLDLNDVQASTFWWSVRMPFANLEDVTMQCAQILEDAWIAARRFASDDNLSVQGRMDGKGSIQEAALNAVNAQETRAREAYEGAKQLIEAALAPKVTSPQDALLRETQEQRAWGRIKPLLDKANFRDNSVGFWNVFAGVLDNADEATVGALRAEMTFYLNTLDAPAALIKQYVVQIADAELKYLSQSGRLARMAETALFDGYQRVILGIGQVRREVQGIQQMEEYTPQPTAFQSIIGFGRNSTLRINIAETIPSRGDVETKHFAQARRLLGS